MSNPDWNLSTTGNSIVTAPTVSAVADTLSSEPCCSTINTAVPAVNTRQSTVNVNVCRVGKVKLPGGGWSVGILDDAADICANLRRQPRSARPPGNQQGSEKRKVQSSSLQRSLTIQGMGPACLTGSDNSSRNASAR